MKNLLSTLVFVSLFVPANCQTFAVEAASVFHEPAGYAVFNSVSYRTHRKLRPINIVGLCVAATGGTCVIASVGLFIELGGEHSTEAIDNLTTTLLVSGTIMSIAGAFMASSQSSRFKRAYTRWNVVVPKKNELGFAYNF